MRVTGSRVYSRPAPIPKMPPGLVEIMEGLSKEVLRSNPQDVYAFCATHMEKLLEIRDGPSTKKTLSLEQKIHRAQEKVKKRAEQRCVIMKREVSKRNGSTDNTEKPQIKELFMLETLATNEMKPLHHECVLKNQSEIEISCEPGQSSIIHDLISEDLDKSQESTISDKGIQNNDIKEDIVKETFVTELNNEMHLCDSNHESKKELTKEEIKNHTDEMYSICNIDTVSGHVINEIQNKMVSVGANNTADDNFVEKKYKNDECNGEKISVPENVPNNDDIDRKFQSSAENETSNENLISLSERVNDVKESDEITSSDKTNSSKHDDEVVDLKKDISIDKQEDSNGEKDRSNEVFKTEESDSKANDTENYETLVSSGHSDNLTTNLNTAIKDEVVEREEIQNEASVSTAENSRSLNLKTDINIKQHDENCADGCIDSINVSDNIGENSVNVGNQSNEKAPQSNVVKTDSNDGAIESIVSKATDMQYASNVGFKSIELSGDVNNFTDNKESKLGPINYDNAEIIGNIIVESEKCDILNDNANNVQGDNTTALEKSSSVDDSTNEDSHSTTVEGEGVMTDCSEDTAQNDATNTMNLENAAVTIQKVFRTFLFKSRASTFDESTNEDNNSDEDVDGEDREEDRSFISTQNKDRRALGISRMDTVLQTVNEEKSLSLSTDDSSLSSAATIIQAHVRGFLVRNKLCSGKTASSNSLLNSNDGQTVSLEADTEQHKNKTILNIHIVPEGGNFLSRDESVITSMDLSLDGSPPSSINLHPLGYDISERRKLLKREDAIQSISPPSNNSGKLSEDSVKEFPINDTHSNRFLEQEPVSAVSLKEDLNQESGVYSAETISSKSNPDTVLDVNNGKNEMLSSIESVCNNSDKIKGPLLKQSSDEMDVVTPFNENITPRNTDSTSGLLHSGEFHDPVLPTKVSRNDTPVASEFKNVLVYFLIWNNS